MSGSDGNFKWYFGGGAQPEYYTQEESREAALRAARIDYPEGDFTICEADKAVPSHDVFDGGHIIERFEELNEDCWGEDGAEIHPTGEQRRELEAALSATLKDWMDKHGLNGRVWSFGTTRNEEYFPHVDEVTAA